MEKKMDYGSVIHASIDEILREKSESELRKDFEITYCKQIDDLFQEYLLGLACQKLKGSDRVIDQPIQDLPLPSKAKNVLISNGIEHVGDLLSYSYSDLSHLKELGQISVKRIEKYLSMVGLNLHR